MFTGPQASLPPSKIVHLIAIALLLGASLHPATAASSKRRRRRAVTHHSLVQHRAAATLAVIQRASVVTSPKSTSIAPSAPIIRGGPWLSPTYADSTAADFVDGEDLDVRRAAVAALGPYNGSVVVVDSSNGRILTMVNQKLALGSGFQPCSTIKVSVALTALRDGLITPTQKMNGIDLKYALAHSNNLFFATLGTRLGYDKVSKFAHLLGYGEKAGWNIAGEQAGYYPPAPPRNGGMGMLTSFGEEISQTPLELAALMCAMANGGKLFYLQYPRSQLEAQHFISKVKRDLNIQDLIPEVKPGMLGAVAFGTARRALQDQPIAGKTGTCTDSHTHLGWFGSFNDSGARKLVVVVLLTGGRPSIGPMAAGVAGDVYRHLGEVNYFVRKSPGMPLALVAPTCCAK
jgi:cell division protein FtsI/penicillin-binding protein 2